MSTELRETHSMLYIVAVIEGILLSLMIAACVVLVVRQVDLYTLTAHLSSITTCHSQQVQKLSDNLQLRATLGDKSRLAQITLDTAEKRYAPGSPALKAAYTQFGDVITTVNTELAHVPVPVYQACK
jgi:hypothetical protein